MDVLTSARQPGSSPDLRCSGFPLCEALLKFLLPDKCYAGNFFSASGIHSKIREVLQAGGLQTGPSWSVSSVA